MEEVPVIHADGTGAVLSDIYCSGGERELTVRKTSLFHPGDGYAAYDHASGDLIFRVDTYARRVPTLEDQLVLMEPSGASVLTVRSKWPSLHHRWEGFLGDRTEGQKPLFTVRRSSIFGGDRGGIAAEVHCGDGGGADPEYRIEGSFAHRSCRVLYDQGAAGGGGQAGVEGDRISTTDQNKAVRVGEKVVVVAEIKRKVDESVHVVLGKDVFSLCLRPRFDAAFAMGLVLILDQISSGDGGDLSQEGDAVKDGEGALPHPTAAAE